MTSPARTGMVDTHAPPIRLLAKMGAILSILDEIASADVVVVDWKPIRSLLADRHIQAWLEGMRKSGYLPLDASSREEVLDLDKIFGKPQTKISIPPRIKRVVGEGDREWKARKEQYARHECGYSELDAPETKLFPGVTKKRAKLRSKQRAKYKRNMAKKKRAKK